MFYMSNDNENERDIAEVQESEKRQRKLEIAKWLQDVLDAKKLTKTGWSVSAGMGGRTVARALDMDAQHIQNTLTHTKLAQTAGWRQPLVLGQSPESVPKRETVTRVLVAAMRSEE